MKDYIDGICITAMLKDVIAGTIVVSAIMWLCLHYGICGYGLVISIKNVLILMGINKDAAFAVAMQSYVPLQLTVIGGLSILPCYIVYSRGR